MQALSVHQCITLRATEKHLVDRCYSVRLNNSEIDMTVRRMYVDENRFFLFRNFITITKQLN